MKTFANEGIPRLLVGATPIGNLQEASPRLIEALEQAHTILCEDTRNTHKLLALLGIKNHPRLVSYHKFNEREMLEQALALIRAESTLLVTDAGYPAISDPGSLLIARCHMEGIPVEVVNGPSSIIHALVMSGLNSRTFYFGGFLPSQKGARCRELTKLALLETTLVFLEAPHRIQAMLEDCHQILGHQRVAVLRELTKKNEEIQLGNLGEITVNPLGEFVVVIENHPQVTKPNAEQDAQIDNDIARLLQQGKASAKDIRDYLVQQYHLTKRDAYQRVLDVQKMKEETERYG